MVRVVRRIPSIARRLWQHSSRRPRDLNDRCGFIRTWFAVMARFPHFGRLWGRSKAAWVVVTTRSLDAVGNITKVRTSTLLTEPRSKLRPAVRYYRRTPARLWKCGL